MKEIKLSQGMVALIDDSDFEWLSQWDTWFVIKSHKTYYAVRTDYPTPGKGKRVWMHRVILGLGDKNVLCDHIDLNGLNNQRYNLRPASRSQNMMNRSKFSTSFSKYKGVTWDAQRNKWKAHIYNAGKTRCIGRFKDEEKAALAYNNEAIKYYNDFANLNIVPCGS